MVPCQLLTAVTDRTAGPSDPGPGDGQAFQLIWFLTAANRPTRRAKPHSVGGRWNENSLLNLFARCSYTCATRACDYKT